MNHDVELILLALKKQLKAQKISYAELGQRLHLSEAAIKNIFYSRSISLEKLVQFCDAIGINVGELCQNAGLGLGDDFELSEKNEDFFIRNPDYFQFFRELVLHRKSVRVIKKDYGLTEISLQTYLKQLEKMGLIERREKNHVRLLVKGRFRWRKNGPWFKKNYLKNLNSQAQKFTQPQVEDTQFLSYGGFSLSKKNLLRLYSEMEKIVEEYKVISFSNLLAKSDTERKSEIFVAWNILVSPEAPGIESQGIKNITEGA